MRSYFSLNTSYYVLLLLRPRNKKSKTQILLCCPMKKDGLDFVKKRNKCLPVVVIAALSALVINTQWLLALPCTRYL